MQQKNKSTRSLLTYGIMILFSNLFFTTHQNNTKQPDISQNNLKILVLIICSDDLPVYKELQKIWKSYMHKDKEHVEAYFIRGDQRLQKPFFIDGDTIWCRTIESLRPGIINKTILSLDAMAPRIDEFSYLLRTNLSSFYVFPKLLEYLQNCPRTNFYAAGCCFGKDATHVGFDYCEGSGILLSQDLIKDVIYNRDFFLDSLVPDDVIITKFFKDIGIKPIQHKRIAFMNRQSFTRMNPNIIATSNCFSFRIKTNNRMIDDIYIQKELLKIFYPDSIYLRTHGDRKKITMEYQKKRKERTLL